MMQTDRDGNQVQDSARLQDDCCVGKKLGLQAGRGVNAS